MDGKGQENKGEASTTETVPATKRPYAPPRLRLLGSVRELTLGATMGSAGDGGVGMRNPM